MWGEEGVGTTSIQAPVICVNVLSGQRKDIVGMACLSIILSHKPKISSTNMTYISGHRKRNKNLQSQKFDCTSNSEYDSDESNAIDGDDSDGSDIKNDHVSDSLVLEPDEPVKIKGSPCVIPNRPQSHKR